MSTTTKATAPAAPTTATPSAPKFATLSPADSLMVLLKDIAGRGKAPKGHHITDTELNQLRQGYQWAKHSTKADKTPRDKTFAPTNGATHGYYFDRKDDQCMVFIYKLKTTTNAFVLHSERAPF